MKTKLKIAVFVAILLSSILLKTRTSKENDLVSTNIEALANGEGSATPRCFLRGSVDCPSNNVKVYQVW